MGAYDSAQIADLISINILDTVDRLINLKQVGFYKDYDLIFIPDSKNVEIK